MTMIGGRSAQEAGARDGRQGGELRDVWAGIVGGILGCTSSMGMGRG